MSHGRCTVRPTTPEEPLLLLRPGSLSNERRWGLVDNESQLLVPVSSRPGSTSFLLSKVDRLFSRVDRLHSQSPFSLCVFALESALGHPEATSSVLTSSTLRPLGEPWAGATSEGREALGSLMPSFLGRRPLFV